MKFTQDLKQLGWSAASSNKPIQVGPLPNSPAPTDSSSSLGRPLKQQDYGNKFHRAALDGYVDMLCEASRRDTNLVARDHHLQLTPTLVAAQCGQLDALRMLVGRGGDPERVTSLGSSALHLAAARNHLNCVSFLVNFGVNMWALDNELHTAKDVAAVEQSKEVLEYLDQMMARQSAVNTKLVQKLKDKAKNGAEKRRKQMRKLQLKAIKQIERDERLLAKMSQNRRLLKGAHSMGDIKLVGRSCTDLNTLGLNLLSNQCDNSSGQSQRASSTSSGSSKAITNFIQHRVQKDLLANSRRARNQQQRELMFPSSNSNSTSNSSSWPSSSVSSTSGYLSSCSAKSILKSAAPSGTKRASLLSAGSAPKYSDLVGVRSAKLSGVEKKRPAADHRPSAKEAHNSSCSSGSMIASKLRVIGAVSRKVHLKRLLFATTKQTDQLIKHPHDHQYDSNNGRPIVMKRTRSEPDFGAALRQNQDTDDEKGREDATNDHSRPQETIRRASDKADYLKHVENCHSDERSTNTTQQARALHIKTAPPPQPPPPPPPAPVASQDNQQQLLLTQCLSQLKLQQRQQRHDESSSSHSSVSAKQTHPFGHSDELLQHQMSAGEFPLRPSIIKHHQLQSRRPASSDNFPDRPPVSAIDSIGSVGSFVARNQAETDTGQQGPLSPKHRIAASRSTRCPYRPSRFSCSQSSSSSTSDPIQCDSTSCSSSSLDQKSNNSSAGLHQPQDVQLREFLERNKLADLGQVLARERIDFEALLLLDESDLKSIKLLLGPRRKLLNAIERHKGFSGERSNEGDEARTQKLCMVDTVETQPPGQTIAMTGGYCDPSSLSSARRARRYK